MGDALERDRCRRSGVVAAEFAELPLAGQHPQRIRQSGREALLNADFMGVTPGVVRLVGVIPSATETGIGLSPEVRAAVPGAVDAVVRELATVGVALEPRRERREPDLWWEKRPGP